MVRKLTPQPSPITSKIPVTIKEARTKPDSLETGASVNHDRLLRGPETAAPFVEKNPNAPRMVKETRVFTSHTNFLKTYDGIEGAPLATGMKPYGSIAAILEQSALANMLEDVNMRARVLALVPYVVSLLDDAFIEKLVDALPAQIIPESVLVEEQNWMKNVPEATRNFMLDGQTYPLSGAALFEARKKELKETLKWRRDHLNDALTQHIAQSSEIHPVGS